MTKKQKICRLNKILKQNFVIDKNCYVKIRPKSYVNALKEAGSSVVDLQKYARNNGFPTLTARHVLYNTTMPLVKIDVWRLFLRFLDEKIEEKLNFLENEVK